MTELTIPACHGWEPLTQWPITYLGYEVGPAGALDEWQRDRCAMCGVDHGRRLKLDHCHHTGLVRGWLCSGCNIREGQWGDVEPFRSYRLRPPSVILGRTSPYASRTGGITRQLFPFHRPRPDDEADAAAFLEAEAARLLWWRCLPEHREAAAELVERLCGVGSVDVLTMHESSGRDRLTAAVDSIPTDHLE